MRLKVEYIPIDDLNPYEGNAKLHPEEQIEQIKESIKQFGFEDPIGIWGKDNTIVEGHGRLVAAKELGMKEVPVIRLDDLTDEQRRAYTLVHNKLTMNSDFDTSTLDEELLRIDDVDMSEFGFDDEDFSYLNDLTENVVAEGQRENLNTFAVTFSFDKAYEDDVKDYIRDNGKDKLIEMILNEVRRNA